MPISKWIDGAVSSNDGQQNGGIRSVAPHRSRHSKPHCAARHSTTTAAGKKQTAEVKVEWTHDEATTTQAEGSQSVSQSVND